MNLFNVGSAACSADPVELWIGAQPAKLEIPFGHAFDKWGLLLPESALGRASRRSAGRPSRAARTRARRLEGHFRITIIGSQRFEETVSQSRSVPQTGQLLRRLSVGDCLVGHALGMPRPRPMPVA
jgi:hypothetical protein